MKTIEERAKAFCEKNICVDCGDRKDCDRKCLGTCIPTYDAFEWLIQFGKSEHSERTRWRDPKEELPQNGKTVIIRLKSLPHYAVGYYTPNSRHEYEWQTAERIIPNSMVIGWREIHENE